MSKDPSEEARREYARYRRAQVNFSAYILAAGLLLVVIAFVISLFT